MKKEIQNKPITNDSPPQKTMNASVVKATMENNWAEVSWADRATFMKHLCDSLRIPFPLNPFRFIPMSVKKDNQWAKTVALYAPAEAFSLIAKKNAISTEPIDGFGSEKTGLDTNTMIYTVCIKATDADGRKTIDFGKMFVGGKVGQDLADLQSKTMTKAKRRAIKSLVGVSVYDEDDIAWMKRSGSATIEDPKSQQIDMAIDDISQEVPQISKTTEDEDARISLVSYLIGKDGMFKDELMKAREWIETTSGKPFNKLDANDVQELFASLEDENSGGELVEIDNTSEEEMPF